MEFDKKALIEYRIKRADETINEARNDIENNFLFSASNRIYYSIFYIVSALALKYDFSTSKHMQLLGWFNKYIVHPGIVSTKLMEIYQNAYNFRKKSDYDDFVEIDIEQINEHNKDMLIFVAEIKKMILSDINLEESEN